MHATAQAVHHSSATEPTRSAGIEITEPGRLLAWLHIGRLTLVAALLAGSAGAVFSIAGWTALIATAITGAAFWYSRRVEPRIPPTYLYAQLVLDAVLLTWVVHLTGGPRSAFAPLYILLVGVAALLLSTTGGVRVALLCVALYFSVDFWVSQGPPSGAVVLQAVLFVAVAPVIGYLGRRLRDAGTALGELQNELARLRLDTGDILDTMSTGVLTVDAEGVLAYINPAGEELLQLAGERWLGQPVLSHLDAVAPGLGEVIARSARERIPIRRSETRPLAEDAFVLGVSTTVLPRGSDDGALITAIFQDITVRKRVEALRRRAERLEAVAGLSASLAHEIKNPLASIRSAVEQLAAGGIDPGDDQVLKGLVVRESDRLSRLLSEFLDFAKVQVPAVEPVEISGLVGRVVELVRAHPDAQGRSLELRTAAGNDAVWARGAEDLLHRAVFNLVLNAAQWAGQGGRVILTLNQLTSDLLRPATGSERLIRLTVTDTGPGVPEEIREEIFDPFFTRRAGGNGLGLALVQRAVEAHSGGIFVDDAPGGVPGARFSLYLPSAELPPVQSGLRTATEPQLCHT
jgi:two-component system, NtrC family, sensor histidine kinase PilS